ncbi:hypothetical protein R3P38DRAFT_2852190 [Favolaschia claudopus]|uniref:Uncharacterized protein n=1 Tax=Favolaschia claudopus TaxID=2862362 RepID=A0AAW0DME2_9AGAR
MYILSTLAIGLSRIPTTQGTTANLLYVGLLRETAYSDAATKSPPEAWAQPWNLSSQVYRLIECSLAEDGRRLYGMLLRQGDWIFHASYTRQILYCICAATYFCRLSHIIFEVLHMEVAWPASTHRCRCCSYVNLGCHWARRDATRWSTRLLLILMLSAQPVQRVKVFFGFFDSRNSEQACLVHD